MNTLEGCYLMSISYRTLSLTYRDHQLRCVRVRSNEHLITGYKVSQTGAIIEMA